MKHFGILTLLLAAILSPMVSARLSLIRLAQGDETSQLRGLTTHKETTAEEAHVAFRELMAFWSVPGSMSTSMSTSVIPLPPGLPDPSPVEIPGFDFGMFYSMSMSFSMPAYPGIPVIPASPSPGTGGALPVAVDDAGATTTDEAGSTTGGDGADTTTADNLGKSAASSSSSGSSTPQTILLVVLVGAAVAVMSAWVVRKNQRAASSNASQMTPVSAPLV